MFESLADVDEDDASSELTMGGELITGVASLRRHALNKSLRKLQSNQPNSNYEHSDAFTSAAATDAATDASHTSEVGVREQHSVRAGHGVSALCGAMFTPHKGAAAVGGGPRLEEEVLLVTREANSAPTW